MGWLWKKCKPSEVPGSANRPDAEKATVVREDKTGRMSPNQGNFLPFLRTGNQASSEKRPIEIRRREIEAVPVAVFL
jgi:hypothetical protein